MGKIGQGWHDMKAERKTLGGGFNPAEGSIWRHRGVLFQ
jgi:hypothetical protein